jgi:3-methylfumaryl-CoA hydratase
VESVQDKHGRSGRLTFVTVRHHILQRGSVVIDERQDIVYRDAVPSPGQAGAHPDEQPTIPPADGEWAIEVSPTLLFRFSALTYNAHRIHYDRDYARDVEGYPGLLTHGPLQALTMAEAARAAGWHDGDLSFDYRLLSPLFDYQGMVVSAGRDQETVVTAVRDLHGRQTAAGTLSTEKPAAQEGPR